MEHQREFECPYCDKIFKGGEDEDSALFDDMGDAFIQFRDKSYYKIAAHVQKTHPEQTMLCPRRVESPHANDMFPFKDYWRKDERGFHSCSFCGSLKNEEFFTALDDGRLLTPTDKNYKVYMEIENALAGQTYQSGSRSGPAFNRDGSRTRDDLTDEEIKAGRYERPNYSQYGQTATTKFYFQHLDSAEMLRFFNDYFQAGKINFAHPGHFYVLPFFIGRKNKDGN